MPKRKIFVVGGAIHYANWCGMEPVYDMEAADVVMFTGGSDVDPSFYNLPKHPTTMSDPVRDNEERLAHLRAFDLGKPTIGICRGAQFLCVMAGGILVQHQDNRHYFHEIFTDDPEYRRVMVTSTHHQAQYPWALPLADRRIIGWSKGESTFHQNHDRTEMVDDPAFVIAGDKKVYITGREVEIAYYRTINALGIQSHPEMVFKEYDRNTRIRHYIDYCKRLLDGLLAGTL